MKKIMAILFLFSFLTFNVGAETVSFIVIETGLSGEGKNQHSLLWENELLDIFFDSGFIVSNAPVTRFETKPEQSKMQDFIIKNTNEAEESGADYFIAVQLDYPAGSAEPEMKPREAEFNIFKISPFSKLYTKRLSLINNKPAMKESDDVKKIVKGLVQYLQGN